MKRLPALNFDPSKQAPRAQSPFYLYCETRLEALWSAYQDSLGNLKDQIHTHFAMKSNNNPDLLKFFKSKGCGLDLVSGVEMQMGLRSGFLPKDLIFSGVGKTNTELEQALERKIELIVVESRGEIDRLEKISQRKSLKAPIAIRVNPDVDAKTHPYISTGLHEHKFGVDFEEALLLFKRAALSPHLNPLGLSVHIGSQMLDLSAFDEALKLSVSLAKDLKTLGIDLEILDVGGGLGIPYNDCDQMPPFLNYGKILQSASKAWRELQGKEARLYTELGRSLVAQAGFLFTQVLGTKKSLRKNFLIVDASMTELLRPALYQAQHPIVALKTSPENILYDVVGPVCESSDVLGTDRKLPKDLQEGDWLRVEGAGAYGYVMASHYNGRPLPEEWWLAMDSKLNLSRARRELSASEALHA